LPDPDGLRARLAARGAVPTGRSRQIDTYFTPPHRDFLAGDVVDEWLRLRAEDSGATSLNYKLFHPIRATAKTYCDEYETPVADREALRRTLRALDFTEIAVVDKLREEWRLDTVVVAIDTVAGCGTFAELEFTGDADGPAQALAALHRFAGELPLGAPVTHGYPHMVLGRIC
jgi:adenylate cyclase class 2